jgi:hypothetical protein
VLRPLLAFLTFAVVGCGARFEEIDSGSGGAPAASAGGTGSSGGGPQCNNFALSFDGVDDEVVAEAGTALNISTFTVEMWVNPTSPYEEGERRLWTYGQHGTSGHTLLLSQEENILGHLEARIFTPDERPATDDMRLPLDTWTHVAMVYEEPELRLYVGGVLTAEESPVLPPVEVDGPLLIGNSGPGASQHLMFGLIDEVRMSRVARYDANFMPQRIPAEDDDTFLLFHFDEGEGSAVGDVGGRLKGELLGSEGDNPAGPAFVSAPCE